MFMLPMGTTTVAAFSSCEITLTGDALTEVQNSNELVVTTCDDGIDLPNSARREFRAGELSRMPLAIATFQEVAGDKSRLTL